MLILAPQRSRVQHWIFLTDRGENVISSKWRSASFWYDAIWGGGVIIQTPWPQRQLQLMEAAGVWGHLSLYTVVRTQFNDLWLKCVCLTTRWGICNYVSLSHTRAHTEKRKDKRGKSLAHQVLWCLWAWLLAARAALSFAIIVHQQLHQPSARHSHKRHQQHLKSNYRWQNEPSWLMSGDWRGWGGVSATRQ